MRRPAPLLFLALAGCGSAESGVTCPAESCVRQESSTSYELNPEHPIDLLVVMDDSASMATQQADVVAALAPELEKIPGGLPELRVRVVSSSVPTPGLAGFPGCAPAESRTCVLAGGYLEATRVCGRQSTFSGPFSEAFACANGVGAAGCGWEQPLAAARAALEGDPQDGSRFLRRGASLFVVIITDEDDCSVAAGASPFGPAPAAPDDPVLTERCRAASAGELVPVRDYATFFRDLKPRPYDTLVTVLAGWRGDGLAPSAEPVCQRNGSPVLPAVRLRAFVEALENQGELYDLCSADPGSAIRHIGEKLAVKLSAPCLPEGLIDADPVAAGVQPMCTVTEATLDSDGKPIAQRALPTCDSDAGLPCWRAEEQLVCSSRMQAWIERGCRVGAPTSVTFRCATAPSP
jgi:hypothetical protein